MYVKDFEKLETALENNFTQYINSVDNKTNTYEDEETLELSEHTTEIFIHLYTNFNYTIAITLKDDIEIKKYADDSYSEESTSNILEQVEDLMIVQRVVEFIKKWFRDVMEIEVEE